MSDSESECDSLLVESLDEDESNSDRRRADNRSGSHRNQKNKNDYVICRKPTRIIQYESSEIFYHKSHASSRTTRLLRTLLLVMCLATVLTVFAYVSTSITNSSRIATLPGWDRKTTRYIPVYVQPNVTTTLIEPTNVCDGDGKLLLLIVVCSSPDNFEKRQTIRETWANMTEFNYPTFAQMHATFNGSYLEISDPEWRQYATHDDMLDDSDPSTAEFRVKIVFLIGQTESNVTQMGIYEESEMHNDLIQESFLDSYNNLTLKTVMMLKWVNGSCADKLQFLMKCDDDTFVNVPNLLHVLLGGTVPVYIATLLQYDVRNIHAKSIGNRLQTSMAKNLLIGHRFCHTKPIVNASSKWYSPNYMYDKETYPNYLSGTGYVMSTDIALRLYNVSLTTPLFHLEDVYLTGICAEAASIHPQNHPLFNFSRYKYLCEIRGTITTHQMTSTEMKRAYDFAMDMDEICHAPQAKRKLRPINKVNHCS